MTKVQVREFDLDSRRLALVTSTISAVFHILVIVHELFLFRRKKLGFLLGVKPLPWLVSSIEPASCEPEEVICVETVQLMQEDMESEPD